MRECHRLATEANRVLLGPKGLEDLKTTMTLTYEAIVNILERLDDPKAATVAQHYIRHHHGGEAGTGLFPARD
jgi:hypothetical protein